MAVLLSVVFGLLVYAIHVDGLTLCDTDGTLEVVETTASNVFTCTGADSNDLITWILQRSNGNTDLATCTPLPDSCNSLLNPPFEASRPAGDRSTLTVNGSTTSYLEYIQGQTIVCKTIPVPGISPQQTQCTADVVAVPSVTCDAHYNTGTSSPWTLTANCNVSGAYSYLNRYTCHLIQTSPTTKSLGSGNLVLTSTSGSGGKYKTGYCQVTVPYPDVTGVYSYKMAVTPGRQNVPARIGGQRSFEIKRPSTPPSHNCPQYVRESQGTSCTCTATDLGQPAGVVRWTSTMTNQLSLSNANKNDTGTTNTCEVIWNGQRTQSVTYTLQVAYGPSSVSITHPPFPYDTNGQQQPTLTCSASDVSHDATFTWVKGSANKVVGQGRTYTFRPQPPGDDNSVFVCRAVNSVTGTSRQDSTTLNLNYPPTQNPAITITSTPSNPGGHLYQGDRVTLTCAVTGGKPFGATTVTFTCPGKQDSPDIVGSSGVTSTLTFDSLTAADHDKVCTCTTRWKNTNWYNKNKTVKLFVTSPPSSPAITKPDNDYPPIATVTRSATLTCHSTTSGVPISTYTWPITQGERQGPDGQGRGTLTFDTISKELDGKNVNCRARNRFTDNRPAHTVPDGEFTLEVYYNPEISTEPVEDTDPNQCEITSSDKSQCSVTEGQRVHFRCSASSNPQPADITWQGHSGKNPDLLIESAKRADTGTYNCSVTTGRGNHGNDRRLPLKGSSLLTVLVKYPPFISSMEINSNPSSTLTVNAGDVLNLSCRAVGRPPPETKIIHPSKTLIARTPQGLPSVADTPSVVSGKLTARCRDTGIYTCTADNAVGSAQQQTFFILVQCKPEARSDAGDIRNPSVNYRTEAVQLDFSVTAYPVPELKRLKFFKQKPDDTAVGQAAEEGTVAVKCFPDSIVSADITCQVTVDNVKPSYAGFYQAFVGNKFGDLRLEFEVRVNATYIEPEPELGPEPGFPVGVIVGVIAAVLVVSATIVVVVLVIRRRRERKDNPTPQSSPRTSDREEPAGPSASISTGAAVGIGAAVMALLFIVIAVIVVVCLWRREWVLPCAAVNRVYQDGVTDPYSTPLDYDSLQASDMGLRSVYTSLPSPDYNTGAAGDTVTDPYTTPSNYDSLQTSDMGLRSVYTSLPSPDYNTGAAGDTGSSFVNKSETGPVYVNKDNSKTDPVLVNKAPQRNQPSTSQASSSHYEDVDVPKAKPVIMPKPTPKPQHGASAAQVATVNDVHVTVNKTNVPQSAPQDSCPVSAADSKKKEGSVDVPAATPGAMKEKPKVGKKPAPNEPKQKGTERNQTTEAPQRNQPSTSQASSSPYEDVDVPSAKPVIKPKPKPKPKPQHGASAAQVATTGDVVATSHKPEPEGSRTVNPDGLVYTAVASTDEQLKKATDPPPVRERTAYAGIEFYKM